MNIFYPIEKFAYWFTYSLLSLKQGSLFGEVINFFVYDVIKISILLLVFIFIVSFLRTYLPFNKIKKILSGKYRIGGNILASLLGIITPFCTCSAIPLFLGFIEAGVPLGVTFSFLVSSPMINEVAVVLLAGMFGIKVALIYVVSGLIISTLSGFIIGKLNLENQVSDFVYDYKSNNVKASIKNLNVRLQYAKKYTNKIFKKVFPYVILGIGLGAFIHGYVPVDFIAKIAGDDKWYAVFVVTLLGIPLYSNAAGVIPLVSVLVEKGVALGTALSFMMAVTGLSLPEFMILKRVMKTKLLAIFAFIVGAGIIITGYLFNIILK